MNTKSQWYHKQSSPYLSLEEAIDLVIKKYEARCYLYHMAKDRQQKEKEFGFLVGMTFQTLKGKARSGELRRLLKKRLESYFQYYNYQI
jgi:Asp-tRNA(Asn)/Glu-tRNA(Gln) amidotransferase B subunit